MDKQVNNPPGKALQESINEIRQPNVETREPEGALAVANKKLLFQNEEKEKRATELVIAKGELAFQKREKGKRAAELLLANEELAFQNKEKEKRANELAVANKELYFQNKDKEKRASDLIIANKELIFQNEEKEKRAAELIIANRELAFQNKEKEKRANELAVANKELLFQNKEKEKRASELIIANKELIFQNQEKEKRAAELIIANRDLKKAEDDIRKLNEEDIRKLNEALEQKVIERTEELEAANQELEAANQELEAFSYSVSHDLRAPLRIVNGYTIILREDYQNIFDDEGKRLLSIIQGSAKKMGVLIDDLLTFSRLGRRGVFKTNVDMNLMVKNAVDELMVLTTHKVTIQINQLSTGLADRSLISQVWLNLLSNAIKYSIHSPKPIIKISCVQHDAEVIYSIAEMASVSTCNTRINYSGCSNGCTIRKNLKEQV